MENLNTFANKKAFNPLNTICIVTGGSSGIGLELIKELKSRKAKKVINIDIKNEGQNDIDFYQCDVGNSESVKVVFAEIYKKYENIDLICCNAGVARDDDGLASEEHWNSVWKTNVLQHVNIVRNCISKMVEKKRLVFNYCISCWVALSSWFRYLFYNKACYCRFCRVVIYYLR